MSYLDKVVGRNKIASEKCGYDNAGFVMTEKHAWHSGKVSFCFFRVENDIVIGFY